MIKSVNSVVKSPYLYNLSNQKQAPVKISFGNSIAGNVNYSFLKPLLNLDKDRIEELREIDKLTKINGVFSQDKAAELIKSKIDAQQMLYSEKDISNTISEITKNNPDISKNEALTALASLSSFSNMESISSIEKFCNKNHIYQVYRISGLSANSIFSYFSNNSKGFLNLHCFGENRDKKTVIFVDREVVNILKKEKDANSILYDNIKANIKNGFIKLAVLDGWEAKTSGGLKSLSFAGGCEDLASAAAAVAKEQKKGKNPFIDDIIEDLKSVFGKNTNISIIKNECKNPDEKDILKRLNPKTISKEEIKKTLNGISKFAYEIFGTIPSLYSKKISKTVHENCQKLTKEAALKNLKQVLSEHNSANDVFLSEIQSALIKTLYPVIEVYSPRRLAKELKLLHKNIEEKLKKMGKTIDDAIFVVPNTQKSFGLVTYQYIKVNNIKNPVIIYPNFKDAKVSPDLKKDKVFVFLDDFSGSGQSFTHKDLPYGKIKGNNPETPIIFAAAAYTNKAKTRIEKEFKIASTIMSKKSEDYFIGGHKIDDMINYLKLLPKKVRTVILRSNKCGFEENMNAVMFPHVIPDNCTDIAGFLLKPLLKSDNANKATMGFEKECRIMSLC